jgi:hypothetical protein
MNIFDKKTKLLSEIMTILDNCIRDFIILKIDKKKNIKYVLNLKYIGTWFYLIILSIYIICPFIYMLCNGLIIIAIINTIFFILFLLFENKFPYKINEDKIINKKENYYDQFYENIKEYKPENLLLLIEYIEHLLSRNNKNNNGKFVLVIFFPVIVRIITNNIGKIGDPNFLFYLISSFLICLVFICLYNMLPNTINLEIIKLTRLKIYLEYVLLTNKAEKML